MSFRRLLSSNRPSPASQGARDISAQHSSPGSPDDFSAMSCTAESAQCSADADCTICPAGPAYNDSESGTNDVDRPERFRRGLGMVTVATALVGLVVCAVFGRLSSAIFFVGIPCLLAFGLGQTSPKTSYGRVMQITTICLLLMSAVLHEAAFCLLLAAPVVYLSAAGGLWITRRIRRRTTVQVFAVPLIALLAVEGLTPQLRVGQYQEAVASAEYHQSCETLPHRLSQGPKSVPGSRYGLLKLAPYPTPQVMKPVAKAPTSGNQPAFSIGQQWQTIIGPGVLLSEVQSVTAKSVTFKVLNDQSKANRWVDLHQAKLSWQPHDEGCQLTVSVAYSRKLDPGLWFGPITHIFTSHAAATMARTLVADPSSHRQ